MTLEELIYSRLTQTQQLADILAPFNDAPAVFYQSAPEDTADGWNGQRQYPRIDFLVDMQANPERQTSGVLALNIWSSENALPPEEIEPLIRATLCDIFIQPDERPPFSLAWARSDAFEQKRQVKPETLVTGITVTFDVYAFPVQETTDPDPILAINEYVKDWAPQAVVVGKDGIGNFYAPTEERPAFYFRLASLQSARQTNTVAWMDGVIAGHVFAPEEARTAWLKSLVDKLALDGEVIMLDTSPMFIQGIKADSSADRLTLGQLRISARFGILRRQDYAHTLLQPHFTTKRGG